MKKFLIMLFFAFGMALPVAANVSVIEGVPVTAEAENAVAAREAALKSGQEDAFNRLMRKMVAPEHVEKIVPPTPEQLMDMVMDVAVSNEKTTATRYMGSVTVRFKTQAVQSFLTAREIPFKAALPEPFLIVPVYQNDVMIFGLEEANPFYQSLKQSVPTGPTYRFKVPAGDEADVAAVQALINTQSVKALYPLLNKYGVSRALVVSITQSGTTYRIKTYVTPAAHMPEAEVDFTVTDDRERPAVVASDLMKDMVRYMEKQWAHKELVRDVQKETIQAAIKLKSAAEMGRLQKELKRMRGVESAKVKGIQNKQLLVELTYVGDVDTLPERVTGPFVLTQENGAYFLTEKGVFDEKAE